MHQAKLPLKEPACGYISIVWCCLPEDDPLCQTHHVKTSCPLNVVPAVKRKSLLFRARFPQVSVNLWTGEEHKCLTTVSTATGTVCSSHSTKTSESFLPLIYKRRKYTSYLIADSSQIKVYIHGRLVQYSLHVFPVCSWFTNAKGYEC